MCLETQDNFKMFRIDLINGTIIQSKLSSAQLIRDESLSKLLLIFMLRGSLSLSVHLLLFHVFASRLLYLFTCLSFISVFPFPFVCHSLHPVFISLLSLFQPFLCASFVSQFPSISPLSLPRLPCFFLPSSSRQQISIRWL